MHENIRQITLRRSIFVIYDYCSSRNRFLSISARIRIWIKMFVTVSQRVQSFSIISLILASPLLPPPISLFSPSSSLPMYTLETPLTRTTAHRYSAINTLFLGESHKFFIHVSRSLLVSSIFAASFIRRELRRENKSGITKETAGDLSAIDFLSGSQDGRRNVCEILYIVYLPYRYIHIADREDPRYDLLCATFTTLLWQRSSLNKKIK